MNQNYVTKERLEELKADLERMKKQDRAEIAERLKRAKEYGDLSENSEYIDAKEAQSKLENAIFDLEELLRTAVIIKKTTEKNTINVGSTLHATRDGKPYSFTIVGSSEAKPEANLISNESPLGSAFLGKHAGDTVVVSLPNGATASYKITKIE